MAKINKVYFTKNELENKIFKIEDFKGGQHKLYMPNEIFDELLNGRILPNGEKINGFLDACGKRIELCKSSRHIAFAYSYIYLTYYMYRYCKFYYYTTNELINYDIDEKMIKKIMGVPPNSDVYTYITKKDGLLNKLGYIEKVSDKPTDVIVLNNDYDNSIYEFEDFIMESDYPEVYGKNSKNRKINFPVKGFHRQYESVDENVADGTFYDISNTHLVDIDTFIYCMVDIELGVEAFYLYSYLLYRCNTYRIGYTCSIEKLCEQTGLGEKVVNNLLYKLEQRNMITNDHKPYCTNKRNWQITKANTYNINLFNSFITDKQQYKKIPKQIKMNYKEYAKKVGFVNQESLTEDGELPKPKNTKKEIIKKQNEDYFIDEDGNTFKLPF